ncbi:MAG: polysaccharide deacetylase family protein [Clostridia bacterium]|nr:polysaccharide deacetylase family protein [Clostridia bacterium]
MKRACIIIFSLFLFLAVLPGCGHYKINTGLSDLGGVYSANEDDLDFSNEISGRLSEGNDYQYQENTIETIQISQDGQYSNKVLRWGIARKPENMTPDADPGAPQLLSRYGGVFLGDIKKKNIYITFDEGYENGYTGKILDTLRENNAKAVFFITGPYLKEHQDLVRRMVEEGHEVGNHTIHHPSLPEIGDKEIEEELVGLDRAFNEKFGKSMKFLRPPKGEYSERTLAVAQKLGYCNMFWSFAYDDWYRDKVRGADYAYNIVMRNLHNGAVLLLHAVSKDNADALDRIIKGAKEAGYSIGNPLDLLKTDSSKPQEEKKD